MRAQAEAVADEIARLLIDGATIRDRDTGVRRPIGPGDIGVLFRTRESHSLFEAALAKRGVPYYVYKGLGLLRRRRGQGRARARRLSCRSGIEPARRRVAAIAHRPHFGRRR